MSSANRNLASHFLGTRAFPLRSAHGQCGSRRIRMLGAGFTLIELILACSILFVLAAVAVPLARVAVKRRKEADLRYDLREMRTAIDRYKDTADKNLIQ